MKEEQINKITELLIEIRDLLKSKSFASAQMQDEGGGVIGDAQETAWGDWLKRKQPKNDYERIALIVHHLANQQKKESVNISDIVDFIRQNPNGFSNVRDLEKTVSNTKNNSYYGYIEFVDKKEKKYYRLSIKGSQLVHTLPDRPRRKVRK